MPSPDAANFRLSWLIIQKYRTYALTERQEYGGAKMMG